MNPSALKEQDLLYYFTREADYSWISKYYIFAFIEPLQRFCQMRGSQSKILGKLSSTLFKRPFPKLFFSKNSSQDTRAREHWNIVNGFPIKLKIDIGKIFKEPCLYRSIEARSTVSNIYHADLEPFLKDSLNQLLDSLIADACDILSCISVTSQHLI